MCRGGAAWASGFVYRGEWPRSVSSYPMELRLSSIERVVHSFAGRKGGWSWRDNGFFWMRQMVMGCTVQHAQRWWLNLQWVQWFWVDVGCGLVLERAAGCEPDTSVYLVVGWQFGISAVAVVTVGWELCGAVKMQRLIVNGGWDSESSAASVLQMSWNSSLDRVQANIRWWEWSE